MYINLPDRPKLLKTNHNLQVANGQPLNAIGQINLSFTMNGLPLTQNFLVTKGLTRNFILGKNWLKANGVRLYFDLGLLRVGNTYIKLEEDAHVSTILRLNQKTLIKPQTAMMCQVKVNRGLKRSGSNILEITSLNGCIQNDPGLIIRDCKYCSNFGKANSNISKQDQPLL